MANRTQWISGNGQGLTWGAAFNSTDFTSALLTNGDTVLSTVVIANGSTTLDMFMDISVRLSISSATPPAGSNFALWIYALLDNGTTYGDGRLTAGTKAAMTPAFSPCATIPLANVSSTALVGYAQQIIIPPGSFSLAIQNNCGNTLTSTTTVCQYRTYNLNLNN